MSNEITIRREEVSLVDIRRDIKRFPRLNTLTRDAALEGLARIVTKAFLYKGQTADKTNIEFIANALLDEFLTDDTGLGTKYITLEEIWRAIKKSILSTETYGISVSSLYRAVIDYIKSEGASASRQARELNRKQSNTIEQVKPMLTAYVGEMLRKK